MFDKGCVQMSHQQELHYKEVSPMETVTKLKIILKKLGILTNENWQEKSSVGTYSLRVTFAGTNKGANGKGVSREYAMASAYAELFERYQNNFLGNRYGIKNSNFDFDTTYDEKIMTASEIVGNDNSFMRYYCLQMGLDGKTASEKANEFHKLHRIDYFLRGKDDAYVCIPFYSIKEKK